MSYTGDRHMPRVGGGVVPFRGYLGLMAQICVCPGYACPELFKKTNNPVHPPAILLTGYG